MLQRILNQKEIRLLRGITREHRLSWSSNEKQKILKSLQDKIEDLFKSVHGENDQVVITVTKCE